MLPPALLDPGEVVILLLKPSPWFILLGPLTILLTLLGITAAALLLDKHVIDLPGSPRDLVLLGLSAVAVRLIWQLLEWVSRVYVLTDRRVLRVRGVLTVQVFEAPLPQVQHTRLLLTLRERLLGLGSIGFATAGTGGYDAYWIMISQPLEIHRTVAQALRRYGRRH
jgi:uncharacterized membrane protein YdbT with pleckstrin-like domain